MEWAHWFGMICIFLNKGLPHWWNGLVDGGLLVLFWIRDCRSGGIDSLIWDDLDLSEKGIAAVTYWLWIICIVLNNGLLQWRYRVIVGGWLVFFLIIYHQWVNPQLLQSLVKRLPQWWNWLIDCGGFVFSEEVTAAVVELAHWWWMICIFLNKGLPQWWN